MAMSDAAPPDTYLDPYREAIRQHGPGFQATLWGSREAQVIRFDVMIDLAGFDGCTIADVGCGVGDFAARLIERKVGFARFVGFDAVAEMIEQAAARGLDRSQFQAADLLSDAAPLVEARPDYVCFSGTLNTMDDETARRLIRLAWDVAAQGVVFNFLSNRPAARWAERDLTPARRFDTLAWLDWALTLSSRVNFTQSYLDGHDATIMILHDEDASEAGMA